VTTQVVLGYYVGAYGPTVRIDAHELEDLTAVRQLFKGLASKDVTEADFSQALGCGVRSIHSLVVRSVEQRASKVFKLEYHTPRGPVFVWSNTADGWLECAEKIDALVDKDSPGHQYLTGEGIDDALVELCYQE
jgi:hypothetical protein